MTGIIKMAHKNRCPGIALRFAAMMLLMWNLQLSASTVTWTGAGSNNNWSTVADWSCGGGPCTGPMLTALSGADVTFPGGLSSLRVAPIDATATSGLSLDSLTITGSEYTAFTINSGVTLTITNASLNSTFHLTGSGSGNYVSNSGNILVTGGTLFNESGIAISNSPASLTLSGTAIVNNTGGTISNIGGGSFVIGSAAAVQNGTLLGAVTNNGLITSTGANSVTFGSAVLNGGILAGTMTTNGSANSFGATTAVTNTGILSAGSGGSITWNGGTNSGTLGSGSGTLSVTGTVANTLGTINGGTGGATVTATVNGGTISGTIAGSGGTFNNVLFTGAGLVNGSITGAGNTATGTNTFGGTVTNTGTLAINSGVSTIASGEITGSGTVTVTGATLDIALGGEMTGTGSILDENSGVVTLSGTLAVSEANLMGGTFDGTGGFDGGTVTNDGVVLNVNGSAAAWGGSATLGDYDFTNYAQGAGGTLSINFDATGNDEVIDATDTALAGTLDLLNLNGTALTFGSLTDTSYVLIADVGSAVTGSFIALTLPTGWNIVYNGANKPAGDLGDVELDFTGPPPPTPEPATDILLGAAMVGIVLVHKRLVKR
jgi:fibronectin-binding autotransporter adhesin